MAKNSTKALWLVAAVIMTACGHISPDSRDDKQNEIAAMNVQKHPMAADGIVRLSKITVYPEYLNDYLRYAIEVGETSLRIEPGVLTMYAMQDLSDSCNITILESYASQEAYKAHIASEHFQKYKQATLHMVKTLELCDQTPLNPASKLSNIVIDPQK